ncbi:MAG TPA: YbhB/YbcL family Raf kinase inhibitor-like protein [Gemmatimonadaceae bacterium]
MTLLAVVLMSLTLQSPALKAGGEIPARYTCEGEDVAPPLSWSGAPAGTKSFALIVDDPDAPDPKAPKTVWVHWVVYDIPATATSIPEGATSRDLPSGTRVGKNDWKRAMYNGPCPPVGRHHYHFKLYALDESLPDLGEPNKAKLEQAMRGHVLGQAELVATYEKRRG